MRRPLGSSRGQGCMQVSILTCTQFLCFHAAKLFYQLLFDMFRMLGSNLGIPFKNSHFGAAKRGEHFWRSDLQCTGGEETLEDCEGKEMPSCARGEVAGIICYFGGDFS